MDRESALLTLHEAYETGGVPERDLVFVGDLLRKSPNGLSEKQWYWVDKLATQYRAPAVERVVADFSRVYAMFAHARQHLMHPKVMLVCPSGRWIKLYLSGGRSRVPNCVNVVDAEADLWFGRIYADGRWEGGRAAPQDTCEVETLLRQFAADPERVAAEHGRLHGNCCFCMRALKDERSTAVGYGPVCADHFNLAWGSRAA